jgi:CheY-like chemotaxis protein
VLPRVTGVGSFVPERPRVRTLEIEAVTLGAPTPGEARGPPLGGKALAREHSSLNQRHRRRVFGEDSRAKEANPLVTVVVVDDHEQVRETLVDLLSGAGDIDVVGQCTDGDEVLDADRRLRPDVVLMDLAMQRVDGISATQMLLAERPHARVVLLTGTVSASLVRQAAAAGAVGYQLKGDDPIGLIDAVRRVAHGGTAWSPGALALLPPSERGGNGGHGAVAP